MGQEIELTALEERILKHLHTRVERVVGKNYKPPIPTNLFESIIIVCNVTYLPKFFLDVDPGEAAYAIKVLLQKGLVKEYDHKMCPSYVPISYCPRH